MPITLHFENPNPPGVKLEIFRDIVPIDTKNLPAPIATILEHVTQWTDETALKGSVYYYVFKTTGERDTKISRNIEATSLENKGVGPNKLSFGTPEYGYYGSVSTGSFLNANQLAAALGLTFTTYGNPSRYHKFSDQGKTIYVPNSFIGKGLSYNDLVAKGLKEGVIIQHEQRRYKVRLMQGFDPSKQLADYFPDATSTVDTANIPGFTSEYDRLVYPISRYIPRNQISHNVDVQGMSEFGYSSSSWFIMAESYDGNVNLRRGWNGGSAEALTFSALASSTAKSEGVVFLPVIELMPE